MGARFLKRRQLFSHFARDAEDSVGFLVNHANVHSATMSDFKLESLILAQNERWRQA